jgi:bla regulator protein BlaR1
VYGGVAGPLGQPNSCGKQISQMAEEYGAIAAVNANGFVDPNGTGNGGLPVGVVISQGQLCYGDPYSFYEITGRDQEGKLHCGWMTAQQALDMGIRDAACFGPILIKDGVKQDMNGRFGGYNPRTVIGQDEDGTVMILLIEGRMFTSIGLTYPQLVDYCAEIGMVNAGNMDGGASSVMYYQGEQNTIVSTLYGARNMPNCWLVAPES